MKTKRRGSILGATLHYILAIIAFLLNTYSYALPFQYITAISLNPSSVLVAVIAVLGVFVLCNYLVSAINDGEGTFADIYKFTGYSLLPMIICLPLAVGISYGLTLNEEVIISILKILGFWGSGILLVIGIVETHNYTFGQTLKNIILTIIFMVLFFIICVVVFVMFDQIKSFIETFWKEVKLRAGWY
ncbi:MAG: YIP1 family protein [Candidatus Caccosoma sp.]|nr:YIP1 family protein [Candidatus Caccosoma sp.]